MKVGFLALSELLIHLGKIICCSFFMNCIDSWIKFIWSCSFWTSSWWSQRMNVSFSYLSRVDGFNDVDPNVISSKYSMYVLTNTGDNDDPIVSPPPCLYISDPSWSGFFPLSQHRHQIIYWDTGTFFQRGICSQLIPYYC